MKIFRIPTVWIICALFIPRLSGGELEIFPTAELLPTDRQGPFVSIPDGGILCVGDRVASRSFDGGKTWEDSPIFTSEAFVDRPERALIRAKDGTVLFAFLNEKELHKGAKWGEGSIDEWVLPTYVIRSADNGKTWSEPIKIQTAWCGAIRNFVQLKDGRILLVGQSAVPWAHVTIVYRSDDVGLTWTAGNTLELGGNHDHDGAMEAAILPRKDNSLWLLIRTTKGTFFESVSTDAGVTWSAPKSTGIQNNNCCCALGRLADGRVYLLWNRNPNLSAYRFAAADNGDANWYQSREELSIAFSASDGRSWSDPIIVAARYEKQEDEWMMNQVSYPYLFEPKPGTLWITSMFGNCRLCVREADLLAAVDTQKASVSKKIVLLGDSTLAPRAGVEICANLFRQYFKDNRLGGRIVNSSSPSSTTADALAAFDKRVLQQNPDLVVAQFGINDAAVDVWRTPPATAPRVGPKDYEANLREIIRRCKNRNIPVILMTTNQVRWSDKTKELYGKPPYRPDDELGFNDPFLRDYAEIVRRVAASEKTPLVDLFADQDKALQENPAAVAERLLPDGMHPNSAGHRRVFELLLPEIEKRIDFPSRSNFLKTAVTGE